MTECLPCHSPIRYFGGKSGLAPMLIDLLPEHKKYVEIFGGGGNLLAQKPASLEEVYNDIDSDLVNFFLQAKHHGEALMEGLLALPTSRFLYEKWKVEEMPDDDLERAIRWYYKIRQRIHPSNAAVGLRSGWRAGQHKNVALDYRNGVKRIGPFSKRLANVEIINQDFREVIANHDSPSSLLFIDPPYVGKEHNYQGDVNIETHIELAQMLNNIEGKAIVTYYEHPLIEELYAGWNKIVVETYVGSSAIKQGQRRRKERELILMNYDPQPKIVQQSLF